MKTVMLGMMLLASSLTAAERDWQDGTWAEVRVTRPRIVIGVRPRPSPGSSAPAMTEIRTYVIDTKDLRLELKEPTPPPHRSVDAMVGERVRFALEKNTVYIRASDGVEHRLRVTKQIKKER